MVVISDEILSKIQPGLKLSKLTHKNKNGVTRKRFLLPNGSKLTLSIGDLTRFKGDAIVNAANTTCLGGAGVDGAIHKAAGPGLVEECRKIPQINGDRCPTGEARITGGHKLRASFVIHTAGPVYRSNNQAKAKHLLEACYRNSLELATAKGLESVAFPAISTGVYGYPSPKAAIVALTTIRDYFAAKTTETTSLKDIEFVLFPDKYEVWKKAAKEVLAPPTTHSTGGGVRRSSYTRRRSSAAPLTLRSKGRRRAIGRA